MAAPINTSVTLDAAGVLLTLTFDQPVTGVQTNEFLIGGGSFSLSNAISVGDGSTWTMAISPTVSFGASISLSYFGTHTVNGSSQAMVGFTHGITNTSTVGKPSADSGAIFLMM